jgi:hypothetical protein
MRVSGEVVVNGYHSPAWERCEPTYREQIDAYRPSEGMLTFLTDRGLPLDEVVPSLKSYREHRYTGPRQDIGDINYRNFVMTWYMPKTLALQPVQVRAQDPGVSGWRPPEQRRAGGRSR